MKNIVVSFIAGAVIGIAVFAYYRKPTEKVIKQTQVVEQVRVRTVTKTVQKPDGSKEIVQVIEDNSTKTAKGSSTVEKRLKPNWILGVSAGTRLSSFEPVYALETNRRLIGPVFAGAYGRTDGEFGFTIKLEF